MSNLSLHDHLTTTLASGAIFAKVPHDDANPNLLRVLAQSPTALGAYQQLSRLLADSSLQPIERQVVYLTAAHANQCHYCTVPNPLLGATASAADIATAIQREQHLDDPRLQALRRFTAAMTERRGWLPEHQIDAFLDAGFTHENLLDVITGIALVTLSSYANHVSATPIDHHHAPSATERSAHRDHLC
ncbi:carboxymuconolactone decarboxylase family protein [Thioalkalicoccus limnaeus]|uniref:Carboxymuconolactone decarboxylase family protein n=1 Tax=Thioalkalicoccus limnaeus TaxID=120681 RepID=A0ABV4BHF5_9GAMM